MDVICSPLGVIGLERPQKGLSALKESGFDKTLLDMSMACSAWELENLGNQFRETEMKGQKQKKQIRLSEHPEELSNKFKPLLEQCQKDKFRMPVARAPYLLRNTERGDLEKVLSDLTKEGIKVCGQAGCQFLIVKPLFAGVLLGREWESNRKYYLDLVKTARENDVVILLENQCRDVNGHLVRGVCSDADEAAAWIDQLNQESGEERFGFCMDAGACSLCGQNMQDFAVSLGERIKAVILRDCDGHTETSMLPFTSVGRGMSQTDWLGLIRGLREICFDGALIMDFSSTVAAFSHLLRPQLLQLAKTTAQYLKWQIGMKSVLKKYDTRVVFGAGNMCRNYMKCYGEEFPPLFTCDNNKARWGEWFEGLEIRPPEALKELDEDCAIFICNIYYKEIERQLREMGLRNPIEFFNDEYMPSYYFDRLDYWEGEGQ